jgi:predicted DCC family thiol-disulfide oxidoreductase YuxK
MVEKRTQPASSGEGAHLILFDGVCGLCNRLVQFVLRHDARRVFNFASLQSAIGQAMVARTGGDPRELNSFYVVADYRAGDSHAFTKSDAALFVVDRLGWPWKAARLIRVVPARVRDLAYDAIARVRYRIFGRHEQCLIPSAEFRRRFID